MPSNIITYIHDPQNRYYINEWYSQFANDTVINPIPGWGYFIRRRTEDVIINIPKTPYDGDVFGIIDVTPRNEYASATGKLKLRNVYEDSTETTVTYASDTYSRGSTIELQYTQDFQQIFMYNQKDNTWVGSFIKLDVFVDSPIEKPLPYIFYGTCDTRANYVSKEAVINDNTYVHGIGASIRITFTFSNDIDNPTLNVNNTGDFPIMYTKDAHILSGQWLAGQTLDMFFDGNYWVVVDAIPSTAIHASSGGSGGGNDTINKDDIIDIVTEYLDDMPGLTVNPEQIALAIENYLSTHDVGVNEQTVKDIVNAMVESGELQTSDIDEADVNNIISEYINNNHIGSSNFFYGTCETASDINPKIVNIEGSNKALFSLTSGVSIRVKFNDTTLLIDPKLNVENKGSKAIVTNATSTDGSKIELWYAGEIVDFIYDGTSWVVVDGLLRNSVKTAFDTVVDEVLTNNDFSNYVNNFIQTTIQANVSDIIDAKTAATIDAVNDSLDDKISELNVSFNTTIAELNSDIRTKTSALEGTINNSISEMRTRMDNSLSEYNTRINDAINTIGANAQQLIDNTFNNTIDQKIQDRFTNAIQQEINGAKNQLQQDINSVVSILQDTILQSNTELVEQIENANTTLSSNINSRLEEIRAEVQNIVDTTFIDTIDTKIDTAFGATIDEKIRNAFEGAEGTLNTAISESYRKLSEDTTRIETQLNNQLVQIENEISNKLIQLELNISTIISEQFQESINQMMEDTFDTKVELKITSMFSSIIQKQIDDATEEIRETIDTDRRNLRNEFNTLSSGISTRINDVFDQKFASYDRQYRNLIEAESKNIKDTIDEKINTKFETTLDTLMENKFSDMIDEKIQTGFTTIIDTKIATAKNEIESGLNQKIDARINVAIAGSITDLINTKLEEYVAPAIGATY